MVLSVRGIFAGLVLLGLASPAFAQRSVFPVYGGRGDAESTDECPAGSYFVGVVGNVAAWIDQITVVCGELRSDGSIAGGKSIASRGGSGGGFVSAMCGKDQVVTSMSLFRTQENQIAFLSMNCKNIRTAKSGSALIRGNYSGLKVEGPRHACGSGQAGSGMVIRYGRHVNGLALICNTYRAVAAAPTQQPPPTGDAAACKEHTKRQVARLAEAKRLTCPFLSGSGGWNQTEAQFERSCLRLGAGGSAENERGLQASLDSCKKGEKTTTSTTTTDIYDKPPPTAGGEDTKKKIGELRKGRRTVLKSCRSDKWCHVSQGWLWGEHISPGAN